MKEHWRHQKITSPTSYSWRSLKTSKPDRLHKNLSGIRDNYVNAILDKFDKDEREEC